MKRFILKMGFHLIGSKQFLIRYAKKTNSEALLFKSVDLLFLLMLIKIKNNVLFPNAKKKSKHHWNPQKNLQPFSAVYFNRVSLT